MMLATCHLKCQTEPLANRLPSGEIHILLPSTHTNQGNVAAIGGLSFHMGTMRLKTPLKLSMVARDPRLGPLLHYIMRKTTYRISAAYPSGPQERRGVLSVTHLVPWKAFLCCSPVSPHTSPNFCASTPARPRNQLPLVPLWSSRNDHRTRLEFKSQTCKADILTFFY